MATTPVSPSASYVFLRKDGDEAVEQDETHLPKKIFDNVIQTQPGESTNASPLNKVTSNSSNDTSACASMCHQVVINLIYGCDKQIKNLVRIVDPLAFKAKDD